MNDHIKSLLVKFLQNDRLIESELSQLKFWFEQPENNSAVNAWMNEAWSEAEEVDSDIDFEDLINQINQEYQKARDKKTKPFYRLWSTFQKVAAILLFPVILVATYYFIKSSELKTGFAEVIVPQGQKSEILLPDSSHVWINSGSHLKYSAGFLDGTSRDVFLEGEAYFEVVKKERKPFVVHMNRTAVKVLGTKFNVKAYADEQIIETSLLTGKVNLILNEGLENSAIVPMSPGQKLDLNLQTSTYRKMNFVADEVVGWKNNRLIFRDDTFEKLVRKIERWYDVRIQYPQDQLNDQRLTLELHEEESIDRLMEIISKVMHVDYDIDNKLIQIRPMKNS